jgi:hypothetical protein
MRKASKKCVFFYKIQITGERYNKMQKQAAILKRSYVECRQISLRKTQNKKEKRKRAKQLLLPRSHDHKPNVDVEYVSKETNK